MEKKLVKAIMDRHTIKSTSGKSLEIDGAKVLPKKVKEYADSKLAKSCLNKDELIEYYEWIQDDVGEILYNLIKLKLKDKKLAELGLEEGVQLDTKKSFKFTGLIPIKDVLTNENGLYDTKCDQISNIHYDAWFEEAAKDKDYLDLLMSRRLLGLLEYDPYTRQRAKLVEFKDQEIYQFNSHIFPEWRFHEVKTPTPPQFFFSLMEHLFPTTEGRRYVYHWMRNAIFDRNQTVLLLASNMGTGKGTLADIMEQLVGEPNFQKQGEGFFQTRFNAELKNKRLVVFDEVSVGKRTKDQLKLFCNNTIPIEKKGIDVAPAVTNYASYMVMNNYVTENELLADDRRFSVPEITDIPLLDVFSEEEVNEFHKELRYNPEIIQQIGWWLKENGELPHWDVHIPYKKDRFFFLVKNSLKEWQKFIVDKIQSGTEEKYLLIDLRDEYEELTGSKNFAGGSKVANFLSQYKELDGKVVGTCVKEDGEHIVYPTVEYLDI